MKQKINSPLLKSDLQRFEKKITERFNGVDKRFDGIDKRLDGMDKRFDGIDKRLDSVDKRFDGLDERLDSVDKRFDGLDERLDGVEKRLDKKIDATEEILRMEIRLSAENTKEDIKTFFTESVSRIMDSVDVFMVEIKASREERIIMSHQIVRCSERLDVLEQKLHVAI